MLVASLSGEKLKRNCKGQNLFTDQTKVEHYTLLTKILYDLC